MISFSSYKDLDGIPNLIVDGRPHKDSVLVLSHWKGSKTPASLMRDTSAQIVLDYLASYTLPREIIAVSNDHFDQDGLVGVFSILNPEFALANRDLLIDIAEAGDFSKYKKRNAARISFTLAKLIEESANFFKPKVFKLTYPEMAAIFYKNLLSIFPDIMMRLHAYRKYWDKEDRFLSASECLIEEGYVKIIEVDDMAIVEIPSHIDQHTFHWGNEQRRGAVHDMAIHNKTSCAQLLYKQGRSFWFKFRYETWVQYTSQKYPLRVDLHPLSHQLNLLENKTRWHYSGSQSLTPILASDGESSVSFERFYELLCKSLKENSVDWDPFQ